MVQKIRWFGDKILLIYTTMSGCCLIVVVCTTLLQVISRYIFNASVGWSEELARFSFIWMTLLGAPVAVRRGTDPQMGLLKSRLKGKRERIYSILINVGIALTVGSVLPFGIKLCFVVGNHASPALSIPFGILYLCIPAGMFGILIQAVIRIIETAWVSQSVGEQDKEKVA